VFEESQVVGTPMFVIKAYLPVNESFGTFVVPLIFKLLLPTNYALHAICFAGLCVSVCASETVSALSCASETVSALSQVSIDGFSPKVCASETVSALSCASETVSRLRLFLRYPVRLRLFLRCLKYPLMDFHQKSVRLRLFLRYLKYPLMDFHQKSMRLRLFLRYPVRLRLFLRYLKYPLMDFHQTFVTCASLDKDELVRFCVYGRSR